MDPNANPFETDFENPEILAPKSNDEDSEDDIEEDDANIITSILNIGSKN